MNNHKHSVGFVLISGLSTGLFLYIRSFPRLRFDLEPEALLAMLWGPEQVWRLSAYLAVGVAGVLGLWLGLSLALSHVYRRPLAATLRGDAYTYAPLCVLALAAAPAHIFPLQAIGIIAQVWGDVLDCLACVTVISLKFEFMRELRRARFTAKLKNACPGALGFLLRKARPSCCVACGSKKSC